MVISAPGFYSWTEVALHESQFQNKQTNSFGSSLSKDILPLLQLFSYCPMNNKQCYINAQK